MIHRRVVVHGQVQGVWFRETVRQAAEQHGVAGWARNLPDGTVEAVFEGHVQDVDALVEVCRTGPPDARVTRIDVETGAVDGLSGFVVR